MRATPSIASLMISAFVIMIGPVAFSQTATLRYDGTYYRIGADNVTQHLRFYRDGVVISVATPSAKTPKKIAGWFHRDFPGLASGRYSIEGGRIQMTLNVNLPDSLPESFRGSISRTLHYSGVIGPGYLELQREGLPEPKRYDFVKIADSK